MPKSVVDERVTRSSWRADVTAEANDKRQAVPMARNGVGESGSRQRFRVPSMRMASQRRSPTRPTPATSAKRQSRTWRIWGLDPHIATGRQKHHDGEPPASRLEHRRDVEREGADDGGSCVQRTGRCLYAARKHIVEPVFGQIKHVRGFRKFLLRGLDKVAAEWQLVCLSHNLLKIWRVESRSPALSATRCRTEAGEGVE